MDKLFLKFFLEQNFPDLIEEILKHTSNLSYELEASKEVIHRGGEVFVGRHNTVIRNFVWEMEYVGKI